MIEMASTRSNSDSGSSHDGSVFEDWSTDQDQLSVEDALAQCDDEVKPIATEEEAAEYEEIRAREEADEQELNSRFSGEPDISSWLGFFRLVYVIEFLVDATLF